MFENLLSVYRVLTQHIPLANLLLSSQPHGRAWKVLDKRLLVEEVIPKYFGQTKFPSFTRQLSGWGFKRLLGAGPDFGCYYHECFLRGQPLLTHLMRRNSPGTGRGRSAPNALGEPDFYAIAKRFPLRAEKPVSSSTETNAQESVLSQEVAISSSLPLDHVNHAAPAASSTPRDEISTNQSNVQSGSHCNDETGRMCTTMLYSHHYLGAAGNLQGQVESQGRNQGGLVGNSNQQRYQGYHVQHPFPSSHLLDSHFYGDQLVLHQMNSMNQQESINNQHQQRQLQDQPQSRQRASTSTTAISLPNSSSQNSWFETIVAADSSNQLPMSSTQGQSFDFTASSFEDSTRRSALDPSGAFWGYNRKT